MINLNLKKRLFIPKFYPYIKDYSHRWEVWMGSAGSGKSYTIAQKIVIRCCTEKIRILVCRKTGATLRNTCFSLLKEILDKWKITSYVKVRETDMNIRFPNGSEIILLGLDEETKLLSLNNIGCIWIEEAFEVSQDIAEQLNLRMRGKNSNQQIIMSFNPISKNSWLYNFCNNPPESYLYIHSTFNTNPFLSDEYVASLKELYTRNPAKARVFCDGQWGVDAEGLVFSNWKVEEFDAMELAKQGLEIRNGSDLGWVDKTSIIRSLYDKPNKKIYIFDEFYRSGCQYDDILQAIHNMQIGKGKIYFDSAEPRAIEYLRSKGVNAYACIKGADSVKARIMFLQDNQIIVHPSCKNLINELENFSYIKSKKTGEWTEDTTHEWSHAIDGLGYAYSDIYTNKKLKTMSKSALGL